jgi:hypothetical protein
MRLIPTCILLSSLLLSGCVVHHRAQGRHQRVRSHSAPPPAEPAPPPPPSSEVEQPPAPGRQPPPPGRTHRAPPAPRQPALVVRVTPTRGRPGQQVTLHLTPFRSPVTVTFNGRPLPKKTAGNSLKVTVPGNAVSGTFEVEWEGRRYSSQYFTVRP